MNKVEQIRKEIERRHKWYKDEFVKYSHPSLVVDLAAKVEETESILSFIRSLQDKCDGCNNFKGCVTCKNGSEWAHYEEPVSEDLEKDLSTYIQDNFTIDKEQLDRFGIEPKDYLYSMTKDDMLKMVRNFTYWQKERVIDKACEWLKYNFNMPNDFESHLKKAMEK